MVNGAKDAVVPFKEIGFFLIEDMEFGQQEVIEVSEHEGCWWLLGWWKVDPIEVGLDGAKELLRSGVKVAGLERDDSIQTGMPLRWMGYSRGTLGGFGSIGRSNSCSLERKS